MQRTNNSSATLFEEEQHCPLDGLAFRLAHVGRQSPGGPARPLGSVASVDQAARVCGRGIGRLLLQAGGVVSPSSGSRPRGGVPGQLAGHRSLMRDHHRRHSAYWLSAIAACVVILARASPETASPHRCRCRRSERQRLPAGYGPGALSCLRVVDDAEGNAGAASNSAKAPINSNGLSTLADAIRPGLAVAVAVAAATADVLDGGHDSARSPQIVQ
jgi:hypothetical protein